MIVNDSTAVVVDAGGVVAVVGSATQDTAHHSTQMSPSIGRCRPDLELCNFPRCGTLNPVRTLSTFKANQTLVVLGRCSGVF